MHPNAPPLRITTSEPAFQPSPTYGWFPSVTAFVSFWYAGKHVKDDSTWTNAAAAIEEASQLAHDYGLTRESPMEIAVCVTEVEHARIQVDGRWVDPPLSGAKSPRDILMGQHLAWTSRDGAISKDDYTSHRFRFATRFQVQGPMAGESILTPYFSAVVGAFSSADLLGGIANQGLHVENLAVANFEAGNRAGSYRATATGELMLLVRQHNRIPIELISPEVSCYPVGDQVYWDPHNGASTQWELAG